MPIRPQKTAPKAPAHAGGHLVPLDVLFAAARRDDPVIPSRSLLDIVQSSKHLVRWEIEATTAASP